MVKINWYGQSCFKFQDKENTILIDPYSPRKVGLRGPNFKSTITILTNLEKQDSIKKDSPESFSIFSPGEYEIKGIFIYGVGFKRKNKESVLYQIEWDRIKYGILGEINETLNNQEIEELNGIDVLFIPVGGNNVLDKTKAVEIINAIEPKIIVPCCYNIPGIKEKLDPVDYFLKEMGVKNSEKIKTLSLKEKDLSLEESKVIILEPATN